MDRTRTERVIVYIASTLMHGAAPAVVDQPRGAADAPAPPSASEPASPTDALRAVLAAWSAVVEIAAPGAAWCDLTGRVRSVEAGRATGAVLHGRLRRETGGSWAVGVGSNKLLARIAAETAGPAGVGHLRRADVPVRLWPLPVAALPGTDADLCRRLERWRVRTVGDLALLGPARCQRRLGTSAGLTLWRAAHGRDDSPVAPAAAEAGSHTPPLLAAALAARPTHHPQRVG